MSAVIMFLKHHMGALHLIYANVNAGDISAMFVLSVSIDGILPLMLEGNALF